MSLPICRARRAALAAGLAAAAAYGCGPATPELSVEGGAGPGAPAFVLGRAESEPFPLAALQVHACRRLVSARSRGLVPTREAASWYVDWWPRDRPVPRLGRVTYGTVPPGMQEDRPAEALDVVGGCYVVQAASAGGVSGDRSARAAFRIRDGTLVELTGAEIDSLVRPPRP